MCLTGMMLMAVVMVSAVAAGAGAPVVFESAAPAEVTLRTDGGRAVTCEAPCALTVEPGAFELELRAPDKLDRHAPLLVPPEGLRLELAPGITPGRYRAMHAFGLLGMTLAAASAIALIGSAAYDKLYDTDHSKLDIGLSAGLVASAAVGVTLYFVAQHRNRALR